MTRKHFEAIAAIINKNMTTESDYYFPKRGCLVTGVANDLVVYFKTQNPNFNEDKFLEACGL